MPPDPFGQPDVKDTSFPVNTHVQNLRTDQLLILMKLSTENTLMSCITILAGSRAGDVHQ